MNKASHLLGLEATELHIIINKEEEHRREPLELIFAAGLP